MGLFRVFDKHDNKYMKPEDSIFYLTSEGSLEIVRFSFLPKELRDENYEQSKHDFEVEFSSGKKDINDVEIFENDLIEMWENIYKVTYDRVTGAWMPTFVKNATNEFKANEFPKYNYNRPDVWNRVAKVVGKVREEVR